MCLGVCLLALADWNWLNEPGNAIFFVTRLCEGTELSFYQFEVLANTSYVVQVQTWNPNLTTSNDACTPGTAEFTTPYSVTLLDGCFVEVLGSPGCRSRDSGR